MNPRQFATVAAELCGSVVLAGWVVASFAGHRRLPAKAFIYVGREDRFGEMFARGPLYEQANEQGELDW